MKFNFDILKDAGLTQVDFAELVGVSRTTANLWINGKMNPHKFLEPQVKLVLDTIAGVIARGEAPPTAHKKKGRIDIFRAAMERTPPRA